MASLLLIGGTGFFGKSFLDAYKRGLLAEWSIDEVIVMARNPDKLKEEAPELLSEGVVLHQSDITTAQQLPYADYVVHAAASTDASKYLSAGEAEKQNILAGTLNYCQLAPKYHKESQIVFCSSGAVYGYQDSDTPFLTEDMPLGNVEKLSDTKKAYAYAKRDSEQAIAMLADDQSCKVSIARCFAFVGKYLPRDQHFAIGNFLNSIEKKENIVVKASHKVVRSYQYADDLVRWLMVIAECASIQCDVYNVGSDKSIEIHDLASFISSKYDADYIGDLSHPELKDLYLPSTEKAKKSLHLVNQVSLDSAIEKSLLVQR